MEVIVDVKECFDSIELLDILSESVFKPTNERLKIRAERYMSNFHTSIYALAKNDMYIGMVVLDIRNPKQIEILDFAVKKNLQKKGFGRKLIDYCVGAFKSDSIIAETDDDAVGFYKKVGFSVKASGDKNDLGINRYLCTLEIKK